MAVFDHVVTQSDGPETHMVGLGDVFVHSGDGKTTVYSASGMGGGLISRTVENGLDVQNALDYDSPMGLDASRQLVATQIDGETVLLAVGTYGTAIEGWVLNDDGSIKEEKTLTLEGQGADTLTAFTEISVDGEQLFVTASRYSDGLQIWTSDGDSFVSVEAENASSFVQAADVQAIAVAAPNGVPFILAICSSTDDLLAFGVGSDGSLDAPTRIDYRDGLFIDAPTALEVVELAGQTFAIVGAAGSSSISVIEISPRGTMDVVSQINDDRETFFDDLVQLETLEAEGQVFVLAAGSDNGLTLMFLQPDGSLQHLASLDDEMREMALLDPGGLEIVWRDGGLDIFVTGQVLSAETDAGRGITQLRIDDVLDDMPEIHVADADLVYWGTGGADIFVLAETETRQEIRDFDPDEDRLDLSDFGRVYDVEELKITAMSDGAMIVLGDGVVRLYSDDGSSLSSDDFTNENSIGLWDIDIAAPLTIEVGAGTADADFLDGRDGDDTLLGQPIDEVFDALAGQVFRLYQATLGRDPDVTGLINWSTRLETGSHTLLEVVNGFTNSTEFSNTYGETNTTGFVTLLYNNVLGREPDDTGLVNWSARLDNGMSRAEVVIGFSESAEFKSATETDILSYSQAGLQADFADDVFRLYHATLNRNPDQTGFENWSMRLADGVDYVSVVTGFTNSAEFQQTYGTTTNSDFVTLLYDNVLDRTPDVTGLANWVGRLDTTEMTRAEVVKGFAQSAEFRSNTTTDMIEWVKSLGQDDVLSGGGGNNVLMGGLFSDTFVFNASNKGQNVVVDLEPWDVLRMDGFGYESLADIEEHLRVAGETVVFEDAGVEIEFRDTTLEQVLDVEFDL